MASPAPAAFLIEPERHLDIAEGRRKLPPLGLGLAPLASLLLAGAGGGLACLFLLLLKDRQDAPAAAGAGPGAALLYALPVAAALALAAAVRVSWGPCKKALKSWRLSRQGRVLPAEVVFCSAVRDEKGRLIIHMKYRFAAPDGRPIEGVEAFRSRLPGETLPAPRTPLAVYYAADDCYTVL